MNPSLRETNTGGISVNRVWGRTATWGNTPFGDGNGIWAGNRSSPAIADIAGTGEPQVILGIEGADRPGLAFFAAATGAYLGEWFPPDDVLPPGATQPPFYGVTSSPAVGNLDSDLALEIAFLGLDGVLYAVDGTCPAQ